MLTNPGRALDILSMQTIHDKKDEGANAWSLAPAFISPAPPRVYEIRGALGPAVAKQLCVQSPCNTNVKSSNRVVQSFSHLFKICLCDELPEVEQMWYKSKASVHRPSIAQTSSEAACSDPCTSPVHVRLFEALEQSNRINANVGPFRRHPIP